MRRPYLDTALAQTIAWIWLGFLVAGGAVWLACWYRRKTNPNPRRPPKLDRSNSHRLKRRRSKSRSAAKHRR